MWLSLEPFGKRKLRESRRGCNAHTPLSSPSARLSSICFFPCGTLQTTKIKSFNCPPGNAPALGVKGKFLCVILFSGDCRVCLDFKSGLVFQDIIMHWKYRTDRSTGDRKHTPLTGDLKIWDAMLGKDLIWVRFVCCRGWRGRALPRTPQIWGELQTQMKHPPGNQFWDGHSLPQENCPELWIAPGRMAQGREGLSCPQLLSFCHVFCLLALKQESKGYGAGCEESGKRGQKSECPSPLRGLSGTRAVFSHTSANLITEIHFWKTKWG